MRNIIIAGLLSAFFFAAADRNIAQANLDPHVIINEIQISGASSSDEFIELFNPTAESIDLSGCKLTKRTKTGSSESTLVSAAKFSGIIQANGYFLIAHPSYQDKISADLVYSSSTYSVASDNTVFLYDKNGTLLDEVGFGAVNFSENNPAANPDANQSIERTDFADTDDNATDFSMNFSPSPNNKSVIEVAAEESPGGGETPEDAEIISTVPLDTSDICTALSQEIKLNEIFPYPESGNEFVEIINVGEGCVNISGWKIMDETGHRKEFPENSTLGPGEYFLLEGNLYLNNDSDTVYLLGKDASKKEEALDSRHYEKSQKNFSFSFDKQNWRWTSASTPGAENIFDAPADEIATDDTGSEDMKISAVENVYLNEILPNPKGNEEKEEYIELVNDESNSVDLFGWTIRDGSKNGKYVFREHTEIKSGEYLAIYRPDSKITLNNSKESVTLFNPQGEITSSVSFDKSAKDASYGFDGKTWKWSKYLTPGKKNQFDSEPTVKISKPRHIYKDLAADFSAKAKDKETKKLKYSWDFGDGKKSYLKETSHKYQGTGKYTVILSVSDDSQTVNKSFVIAVKNYPRPDLEIIKIIPNPVGKDSDGEIIEIKNNSGKKVSLDGWKIATGSDDKIYNHPISEEISLEANKTKTITQKICKFSFNNKAGKVQLIMPDGKVVDAVEYSKDPPESLRDSKRAGKIAEGEAYAKIDGEWQWIASTNTEIAEKEKPSEEEGSSEATREENISNDGEILGATDENISFYAPPQTGYTPEDAFIFFKFFGLLEYEPRKATFCPAIQTANTLAYF